MSDTSKEATGAALYQKQDGSYHLIGYHSKKLLPAVKNYSVTELELFGLVINIYAFRQLLGNNVVFEVFVDHSAITHILKSKKKPPTRRIQRLIEHLLPFNFTIQYIQGSKMHIADVLSRLAGTNLEPPDKVIPISFTVMKTRTNRQPPKPLELFTASQHKPSQLPPSYVAPKPLSLPLSTPTAKTLRSKKLSSSQKQLAPSKVHKPSYPSATLSHTSPPRTTTS